MANPDNEGFFESIRQDQRFPVMTICYEITAGSKVINRGSFEFSDYGQRRRFAERVKLAYEEGHQVTSWRKKDAS